jgi:hypothetical protein
MSKRSARSVMTRVKTSSRPVELLGLAAADKEAESARLSSTSAM